MKILYYHRLARNGFHYNTYSSTDVFFVLDEEIILCKEQYVMSGSQNYFLTQEKKLLKEALKVLKDSKIRAAEISDVKEFEYEDKKIKKLIQDAKLKSKLESKVHLEIEELLEEASKIESDTS